MAARRGAAREAAWYVAATLQRLQRNEEALEAFLSAEALWPEGRDPVLTWYEAVASHQLGLYGRADSLAASLSGAGGPRIAEQARKLRAQMAPLLTATPADRHLDFYLARARALAASRAPVARLYLAEARALSRRTAPCLRCAEIDRLEASLGGARGAMAR